MDNETLRILNVYRGQPTEPPSRKEFAAITKSDYQATADDKWRHDNSNSVSEMKKMSLYEPMRSKWWVRLDDKKKKKTPTPRTPEAPTPKPAKRTPKKKKTPTTPQLVDKPPNDEAQHVDDNVAGGDNEIFSDEIENIIAAQDATKAAKNAEKVSGEAGGEKTGGEKVETVKEAFEEGVVHTDSSETESDIDLTEIAPTTGHKGKRDRKAGPSRKRKNSDDEDATYVPSPAEVEKIKKGRGKMKRKAQLTGENPRKLKIRKTTTKAVKDTIGESVQIPAERVESVAVEVPVQSEFRIATPPTSPIQETMLVQMEVHVTTLLSNQRTLKNQAQQRRKLQLQSNKVLIKVFLMFHITLILVRHI
ncbi:hypothetical protein HanPI659440_Chr03g0109681 [Helianthus annuus]|nr:hypothetical protein HanPI659440_Chr03g0109681 [Helianthus annuus]